MLWPRADDRPFHRGLKDVAAGVAYRRLPKRGDGAGLRHVCVQNLALLRASAWDEGGSRVSKVPHLRYGGASRQGRAAQSGRVLERRPASRYPSAAPVSVEHPRSDPRCVDPAPRTRRRAVDGDQ